MAITVYEATSKRKKSPKIFNIHSFPTLLPGPFRDNIRLFLQNCSDREAYNIRRNHSVWCTLIVSQSSGVVFPLYIIEENVQRSSLPFCDLCRCVGWSHHFVSKRRYHMIIPEEDQWNRPLNKDILHLPTHLLHGVIHCNGFGHLVSLNGAQDDSTFLSGDEIMNLWDHLCTTLHTQKISVHDVLVKRFMDLRLLHGVAYGCPWFGKWGYKFCLGSFGVTEHNYNRAIQILTSLELKKITHDFRNTIQGKEIRNIISFYKNASENQLVTISDLLQSMFAFASKPGIRKKTIMALASLSPNISTKSTHLSYDSLASFVSKSNNSHWCPERLGHAANAIFYILNEHRAAANGRANLRRRELRDEARKVIGDTGLIDFLIKNIHKITINNQIVLRSTNPADRLSEFSLQDIENVTLSSDSQPGRDVYEDLFTLYKNVLLGYPETHTVSSAAQSILDSKSFMKEFHFKRNEDDKFLTLHCQITPSYDELVTELTRPLPPPELVVVPLGVTIGEAKWVIQRALRDTYFVTSKFVVKEMKMGRRRGGRREEDSDQVELGAGQCGREVWIRGCELDLETKLRYEGGDDENWTVDCGCGAKDDDGERMMACDICQVWQHTRCNCINDDAAEPAVFHCFRCRSVLN